MRNEDFHVDARVPSLHSWGARHHVVELLHGLSVRDVEVVVFAHTLGQPFVTIFGRVTVIGIATPNLAPGATELTLEDAQELNQLVFERVMLEVQRGGSPSVIHTQDWKTIAVGKQLRAALNVPLISSVHLLSQPYLDWWSQEIPKEPLAWERASCVDADLVITVSNAMARAIAETYQVPDER